MRRILGVVAVGVRVGGGSLVALTGTSGGDNGVGSAPLTVEKVVVGTPPPGTEFVVEVACEATQEQFGSEPLDASGPDTASTGPIYPGVSSVQVTVAGLLEAVALVVVAGVDIVNDGELAVRDGAVVGGEGFEVGLEIGPVVRRGVEGETVVRAGLFEASKVEGAGARGGLVVGGLRGEGDAQREHPDRPGGGVDHGTNPQ